MKDKSDKSDEQKIDDIIMKDIDDVIMKDGVTETTIKLTYAIMVIGGELRHWLGRESMLRTFIMSTELYQNSYYVGAMQNMCRLLVSARECGKEYQHLIGHTIYTAEQAIYKSIPTNEKVGIVIKNGMLLTPNGELPIMEELRPYVKLGYPYKYEKMVKASIGEIETLVEYDEAMRITEDHRMDGKKGSIDDTMCVAKVIIETDPTT
jgi:hypothetical protein